MEWLLIGWLIGNGLKEGRKAQRKAEKAERRRQYEEQEEFKAFVASLEGLSPEEKEVRWKMRGEAIRAATTCAAVVALSCMF